MHEHIPDPEVFKRVTGVFTLYRTHCRKKGISLFNGKVARLSSINISGNDVEIETQELEYFDYIKSHLLADADLKRFCFFGRRAEYKTFREYIGSKPELYLELARTLGINILVITKDMKVIMQKRSNKTNIYGGTIYPSASGSLEYSDSICLPEADCDTKKILLSKELSEELAVGPAEIQVMGLVGLYEDNYRLKLPDMFFIAKINTDFFEVKDRYERDLAKDKFETEKITGISINDFFKLENKTLSQPLRVYYEEQELILKYLEESWKE
jgi:hypothetical protein